MITTNFSVVGGFSGLGSMSEESLVRGTLNIDGDDWEGEEEERRKQLLDDLSFDEVREVVEWYRSSIDNGIEDEEESDNHYFEQMDMISNELGLIHVHSFIEDCFKKYPPSD